MGTEITIKSLSKRYGSILALESLNITIAEGEIMAILGPSGSGKSTLLNIISGVVSPNEGHLFIGNQEITKLPSEQRDIGAVFQSYALFPHLSVLENVAFSLRTRRHWMAKEAASQRAREMLALVGLKKCEGRKPKELSGGQQQRVALARALAFQPRVLLLDEALGSLDPILKDQLQRDIRRLRDQLAVTVIYVTHDQQEAMKIADRVAILRNGILQQVGTPAQIYDEPANDFVARFVGEANFMHATIESIGPGQLITVVARWLLQATNNDQYSHGEEILLMVRPEALSICRSDEPLSSMNRISGNIVCLTFLGPTLCLTVDIGNDICWKIYVSRLAGNYDFVLGQTIDIVWPISATRVVGRIRQQNSIVVADGTVGETVSQC